MDSQRRPSPVYRSTRAGTAWCSVVGSVLLAACQGAPRPALQTVAHVDLPRFMGAWYVIASIPTFIERGAHNAVESYELDQRGRVRTTFQFNAGSFNGPLRVHHPIGYVSPDGGGALWGMQFIWPFRADYRIVYLDPEYTQTVIGRERRDYVWIMARTPTIPDADYARLLELLRAQGYSLSRLQKVPQQPLTDRR
jgi:apolipoprotein D and lipocalin family protein